MKTEPDCSNCGVHDKGQDPKCEECRNDFINKRDEDKEERQNE